MSGRLFEVTDRAPDTVLTPQWLFDLMGLTFDLDPCSPLEGSFVPAANVFTVNDDGLEQPWVGSVFVNPPFSDPAPWAHRMMEHGEGIFLSVASLGGWYGELWATADGIVIPERRLWGSLPYLCTLAAFGRHAVGGISRLGRVR